MLFIFIIPDVYFLAALLVVFSNICSGASFVLLNSFLPLIVRNHPRMLYQIALSREPENEMVHSTTTPLLSRLTVDESLPLKDPIITQLELSTQISSTGTGAGYSDSLLFQCASVVIIWTLRSTTFSLQVVLFLAGLWWAIFTIPSAILLRPRQESALTTRNLRISFHSLDWVHFVGKARSLLWRIVKLARQSTDISLLLLAWLPLSDGIAIVPGTTILYAKTILGMKSEPLGLIDIIVTTTGIMGFFTWTDDELWLTFKEDFEGWAEKIFNIAHPHVARNLRDYLRQNGVFVAKGPGFNITKSLMEVLKEADMHRWSQEGIEYQQRSKFNSKQSQSSASIKTEISANEEVKAEPRIIPYNNKTTIPSLNPLLAGYGITNLRKKFPISMKYKGYEDSLDITLEVFYEHCNENGIGTDQLRNAVTIILDGDAPEYYYTNIAPLRITDFKTVIDELRKKFETEQQQIRDFSEWISLSL
ncbi:Autophagy-related protein 22 [Golovinomyces cichoracearum]|uniref:Autophagy-related protein n=1 Tax=Golovinomyces cichoracearum TaxID=62708 RepID=A0A420JAY3_9PEZI|nr:Autophagy-related protein 22 [Golovinomyces cichoracearum]